jgi:hypothetical protein
MSVFRGTNEGEELRLCLLVAHRVLRLASRCNPHMHRASRGFCATPCKRIAANSRHDERAAPSTSMALQRCCSATACACSTPGSKPMPWTSMSASIAATCSSVRIASPRFCDVTVCCVAAVSREPASRSSRRRCSDGLPAMSCRRRRWMSNYSDACFM